MLEHGVRSVLLEMLCMILVTFLAAIVQDPAVQCVYLLTGMHG